MHGGKKLLFVGHVVRENNNKWPPITLTFAIKGKRLRGTLLWTIKGTFEDDIKFIMPNLRTDGNILE